MNLIRFTEADTKAKPFALAARMLNEQGYGIHDTVKALVATGTSEIYAKSVVVHLKTAAYLR